MTSSKDKVSSPSCVPCPTDDAPSFCSTGCPALITLLLLLVWNQLQHITYVSPRYAHRPGAPDLAVDPSILAIGIEPWLWAILVLQVMWAVVPWLSGYFSSEEKAARPRCLKFLGVTSVIIFFLMVSILKGRLADQAGFDLSQGYRMPEVHSGLLLGSLAFAGLVLIFQKAVPGQGFGVALLLMILGAVMGRSDQLGRVFVDSGDLGLFFWTLYYLGAIALLGWGIVWIQRQTIELPPQTLETRSRELVPVNVSFAFLGLLPYGLALVALLLCRALVIGLKAEYHLHSGWVDGLVRCLSPSTWTGTFLLAILLWFSTYVAFHLLYPYHRIAKIIGRQEREVTEFYRPWLDSQLALYSLYLIGILLAGKLLLGTPLSALSVGPMILVLVVGSLHEIRDRYWERRRVQLEHGPLVTAAQAFGLLEAEILRAKLEHGGVPTALRPWTTQTIMPASVPGMGEIDLLVPRSMEEKAAGILTAR